MDACERWEEQISALLDGELSDKERQELLEHLSGCDACRAYLSDLTAIGEAMEAVPAPEGFAQSVMDRVERTSQARRRSPFHWQRWGLLAACCALALLGLWRFHTGGTQPADAALPAGAARSAVTEDYEPAAEEMPEYGSGAEVKVAPALQLDLAECDDGPDLVDYETAVELFGHRLVPCTADGFEGYSLNWVGDGRGGDVIYTGTVYRFANGTATVRDQDREGSLPLAEDYESVVYQGETFYVRDALHGGGRPVVVYLPNGETGLSYSARFDPDVEQDEVFELLLSLRIS